MTRDILIACRHRIANDAMARGEEHDPLVDEIDAVLAEPRAAEGAHTPGEHTAGPWIAAPYSSKVGAPVVAASGRPIAHVTYFRLGEAFANHDRQSAANGRLIAAAPDMLAALEPFAQWADESDDYDPDDTKVDDLGVCDITLGHCRAARAAYQKAKGGAA